MNVTPKPNSYSQPTLLPISLAQTMGAPYGYASVPMAAYQQQISAQPQQMWPSEGTPFKAPPGLAPQAPNGGIVCILPENVACLTVDPNIASTSSASPNQSSCLYGIYYGNGSAPSVPAGWSSMEATNIPRSYFIQQPMQLRIAEVQRPQQMTPPMASPFAQRTSHSHVSYLQPALNAQGTPASSQISYAAAASTAANSSVRVPKNTVCRHFLAGRCNRRNCRFLHVLDTDSPAV